MCLLDAVTLPYSGNMSFHLGDRTKQKMTGVRKASAWSGASLDSPELIYSAEVEPPRAQPPAEWYSGRTSYCQVNSREKHTQRKFAVSGDKHIFTKFKLEARFNGLKDDHGRE